MDVDESIVEKPVPKSSKRGQSSKSAKKSKESAAKTQSVSKQSEIEDHGDNEQKDESNPPTAEPSVDVCEMVKYSLPISLHMIPLYNISVRSPPIISTIDCILFVTASTGFTDHRSEEQHSSTHNLG